MAPKLIVEIVGDSRSFENALNKSSNQTKGFGSSLAKLGKIAAVTGLAVGAVAVEMGKKFAEAAIQAQEETGKLNKAFENAGLNAKKMTGFVSKTEAAQRKLGFTNNETRDSLAKFVTAGDKTAAATKDIALASDLARFKNISLTDATLQLVRAHAGNTRALKGLGVNITPVTTAMDKLKEAHKKSKKPITDTEKALAKSADASATYATITTILQKKIGGQAQEFSKSAKGGMEQFHAQLLNLEETIGAKLLPVIASAVKALNDLLAIFTGSGSASDKFQKALERLGVSAKTSKRIIDDLKETFNDLKRVVVTAFSIMRPILEAFWSEIKSIVTLIDDLIHGRWSKIWGDSVQVIRKVVGLWKTVLVTAVKTLGGVAERIGAAILHGIQSGLSGLASWIIAQVVKPINAIIDALNKVPGVHIAHVGGGGGGGGSTAGIAGRRAGGLPPVTTGLAPTPHPVTGPPAGGRGNVAAGIHFHAPVTVVANNPRELVAALQQTARRGSSSRSGPYAGARLGLI